jgi:hypothetical protein
MGKTVASHTSEEFVAFLAAVVASRPKEDDIHVILDNLSVHKTKRVEELLGLHPNVRLHFTPTYSSWLNQVEICPSAPCSTFRRYGRLVVNAHRRAVCGGLCALDGHLKAAGDISDACDEKARREAKHRSQHQAATVGIEIEDLG